MGFTDTPAETEAQQILAKLDLILETLGTHASAINGMGANVQWIVDNVQGIFKMFGSPQFMNQMMGVMGRGGFPGPAGADEPGATEGTGADGSGSILGQNAAGSQQGI